MSVANAYFQVLAAQDQLRIAHHNLTDAERILAVVQHQFSGGWQHSSKYRTGSAGVEPARFDPAP